MTPVPYLRNAAEGTACPCGPKHDLASPVGLMNAQRMDDGGVAIEADDDQDERRPVHIEGLDEHDDLATGIPGQPLHRVKPHHVRWDVNYRYQEISYGQVHDEDVDTGFMTSSSKDDDEDDHVERHGYQKDGRQGYDAENGLREDLRRTGLRPVVYRHVEVVAVVGID